MAGERVSVHELPDLDAGAIAVIDAYLTQLSLRLPTHTPLAADIRTELRADLIEATTTLLPGSASSIHAAQAATAAFGDIDDLAEAFRPELATRQARRMGLTLLLTGPMVGAAWLATVFLATSGPVSAWRWLPLVAAPLLLVGTPATVFSVASTGRLTRWVCPRTGLTNGAVAVAGITAGTVDVLLLLGSTMLVFLPVSAPSPLVAIAAAASLARLVYIGRAAFRLLGGRRAVGSALPAA